MMVVSSLIFEMVEEIFHWGWSKIMKFVPFDDAQNI